MFQILSLLVPIGLVSLSIGYVKLVFLKQDGSAFVKALKFFASVLFGVVCGYIASKYWEQGAQLLTALVTTFLADQITNRIDKAGLAEIINYIKRKQDNIEPPNNSPPNGNG